MKVELFFLGTSAGIPSVERSMPCIAIRYNGEVILWDAGECCQRRLMEEKVGYGSISSIFISHLHLDHFLGVFGLIETLRMTTDKEELKIFAPKGFEDLLFNKWDFLKIEELKVGKVYEGRGFSISAFPVNHEGEAFGFIFTEKDKRKFYAEKAKALGIEGPMFSEIEKKGKLEVNGRVVRLEEISYIKPGRKVAYTGDTRYEEGIVKYIKEVDVLIHDATFDESLQEEAMERGHSTVRDAALIAKKAKVKTLVLTHISSRYKEDHIHMLLEQAKKYFKGNIIVAYDGFKLEI